MRWTSLGERLREVDEHLGVRNALVSAALAGQTAAFADWRNAVLTARNR
jgi:hypothetical protein